MISHDPSQRAVTQQGLSSQAPGSDYLSQYVTTCKRGITLTLAGFVESARNWSGGCVDTVLTLFVLKVDIVNPCMLTALVLLSSPLGPRTNSREFKLDRECVQRSAFRNGEREVTW